MYTSHPEVVDLLNAAEPDWLAQATARHADATRKTRQKVIGANRNLAARGSRQGPPEASAFPKRPPRPFPTRISSGRPPATPIGESRPRPSPTAIRWRRSAAGETSGAPRTWKESFNAWSREPASDNIVHLAGFKGPPQKRAKRMTEMALHLILTEDPEVMPYLTSPLAA